MDGRKRYAMQHPELMSRKARKGKRASPWGKGPNCATPNARKSWEKIRNDQA